MQANTVMSSQSRAAAPWYAHRWPWLLMLGPGAVVVAGVHTTMLAFSNQDALVVDDYYKQGKAINQDLSRDRIAGSMQAAADIRFDAAAGRIEGSVRRMGQPLAGSFTVKLVHSTLPEKDVRLQVQADAQGRFSAPLPMLDLAKWQVLVEPEQRDWRLHGVWNWPAEKQLSLTADGRLK